MASGGGGLQGGKPPTRPGARGPHRGQTPGGRPWTREAGREPPRESHPRPRRGRYRATAQRRRPARANPGGDSLRPREGGFAGAQATRAAPHHRSAPLKAPMRRCPPGATCAGRCPAPAPGRRRLCRNAASAPSPVRGRRRSQRWCLQPALPPCASLEAGLGTPSPSSTAHPFTQNFSKSCRLFFFEGL